MPTSDTELLLEIGRRLARGRLERNWTQERLATESGVSVATVRRLEAGHSIQLTNWVRILRVLGLDERLLELFPERQLDPLEELRIQRERGRRQRQRASSEPRSKRSAEPASPPTDWTWGEDA